MSETLILPVASVSLLFGLDWLPLLDGRADRVAYRIARQHRATHLVIAGSFAAAVGLAHLRPRQFERDAQPHSAAQNVARLFPSGTVALIITLDDSHYWLVVVHEGAVVARTDKIHGCADEALKSLDELKQAFPQLVLLDGSSLQGPAPSLADVAAASGEHSRLRPVRRWHAGPSGRVRWALLVLVLALLLPQVWKVWKPASPALHAQPSVDARQAWFDAQERAARAVAVHGVHGTWVVLQELYRLPVRLAGWSLVNAGCEPKAGNWYCQARYQRKGPQASNDSFIQAAAPGWAIDFLSIDQVEPSWHVKTVALPLSKAGVRSTAHNQRHLWSALQSILTAFSHMQLGRPAPMAVAVPRDTQGQAIARPAELPDYVLRQVRFDGPLRSAALLLPYTESISWKKIALSLHDMRAATLKASRFQMSLYGDLYEIQSMAADTATNVAAPSSTGTALSATAQ